jgi:hypothetical protein
MAAKALGKDAYTMTLRALTLWRPWPYTIFHLRPGDGPGPKRIENRPMKPPQAARDGPLALHAGKKWDPACSEVCREIGVTLPWKEAAFPRTDGRAPVVYCHPESVLVGVVRVVGWVEGMPRTASRDGVLDAFSWISAQRAREIVNDPWYFGPFGWVLDEVQALAEPVPHAGAQGLWTVDEPAAAAVAAQLLQRRSA